jgi:hypothetical protein
MEREQISFEHFDLDLRVGVIAPTDISFDTPTPKQEKKNPPSY